MVYKGDTPFSLHPYSPKHLSVLYEYWRKLGAQIPYFFPVSPKHWEACLLEDRLEGDLTFKHLETWLAVREAKVLGFIQFGQPSYGWDSAGRRFPDPQIGVIRHLYFDREAPEAGRALLSQAEPFLSQLPLRHAFYHILGMSCNAYHGKLHASLSHVENLLLENGYRVEHENVYYVLPLQGAPSACLQQLELLSPNPSPEIERYELRQSGEPAGTAELRVLHPFSAGCIQDTAYLTWLWIPESLRGKGLGRQLLLELVEILKSRSFGSLHTDTPSTNLGAQRFYEKSGFQNRGRTRSYIYS